ncbi:MAG: class I SAM-dependent methyltransferase [Bryobacterales bacterium]
MTRNREGWIPALGRWRSVSLYVRVVRWFSLEDLPRLIAGRPWSEAGYARARCRLRPWRAGEGSSSPATGGRLIGLDPDQDMLRHARSQVDGVRWAAALAQALPFSDNTLHHITTTLMLHHLTRDQKQARSRRRCACCREAACS